VDLLDLNTCIADFNGEVLATGSLPQRNDMAELIRLDLPIVRLEGVSINHNRLRIFALGTGNSLFASLLQFLQNF
jgi:hypothetical protein